MELSTQECSNEWLTNDRWRSKAHDAVSALKHRLQHGFMQGFIVIVTTISHLYFVLFITFVTFAVATLLFVIVYSYTYTI